MIVREIPWRCYYPTEIDPVLGGPPGVKASDDREDLVRSRGQKKKTPDSRTNPWRTALGRGRYHYVGDVPGGRRLSPRVARSPSRTQRLEDA